MNQVNNNHQARIRQLLMQPGERAQLVRFCYQLTHGDREAAEDIAQEALLTAWQNADSLRDAEAWHPWLFGIARNMYLRWLRRQGRESARCLNTDPASGIDERLLLENRMDAGAPDLDQTLERGEVADVLSRAMSSLTPETRQMLVAHYIEETPQNEIAARLGVSENATAVRLHRGKQALRRILATDLRNEAMALGLIDAQEAGWQETRIWCPFCGKAYLLGYFDTQTPGKFKMRCGQCSFVMGPRVSDFPSDCIFAHHAFDATTVLKGVTGFKPAINRLSTFWGGYFEDGLRRGGVTCVGCGKELPLSGECPPHLRRWPWRGLHVRCERCRKVHVLLPHAFTLCAPPVQRFWKQHGRIRHTRAFPTDGSKGGAPLIVRVESLTSRASLDVILSGKTYEVLETHERKGA